MIATSAFAQSPDNSDITVTGQKLEKKEAKRQSRTFIGQTTTTSFNQYARRNRAVCPRVIGIDQSYAQIVETRIRTVAKTADVKVEADDCAPNLFVLFTTDSNGLMAALRKIKPSLFSSVNVRDRPALYADPAPVRWWHSVEIAGSDGNAVGIGTVTVGEGQSTEALISRSYGSGSLINKETVINLTGSVVVVDIKKATGYPLDSIAAYAAMVSFSQVKPEKSHDRLPSILAMFGDGKSPADAPLDLTPYDYAYVSALYEILPNRAGDVQKSQIANKMAAKLAQ
ncbi:MAG: hypothetical protein AABY88_12910 [Pseudomonadota bacterium]